MQRRDVGVAPALLEFGSGAVEVLGAVQVGVVLEVDGQDLQVELPRPGESGGLTCIERIVGRLASRLVRLSSDVDPKQDLVIQGRLFFRIMDCWAST